MNLGSPRTVSRIHWKVGVPSGISARPVKARRIRGPPSCGRQWIDSCLGVSSSTTQPPLVTRLSADCQTPLWTYHRDDEGHISAHPPVSVSEEMQQHDPDDHDEGGQEDPFCWASKMQPDLQKLKPRFQVISTAVSRGHAHTSRGAPPPVAPDGSRRPSHLMARTGRAHSGCRALSKSLLQHYTSGNEQKWRIFRHFVSLTRMNFRAVRIRTQIRCY